MEPEIDYFGQDPGATKFGNFINYYSFHSANERIKNLSESMFPTITSNEKPVLVLDIGCNTGELTIELKSYLNILYPNSSIHVLAIDIDPILIERANCSNIHNNIKFVQCNIMTKEGCETIIEYLDNFKANMFDITFCFSVTMWIHLNSGDERFIDFLKFLKTISRSIVIEPQPWKCYRNAQRRVKRAGGDFELFNTLHIRQNVGSVIEEVLGSETHEKVYESSMSTWSRTIQSYIQLVNERDKL
ncbi:unnamed protein product [Leptidea sinapis]|uniref:RNA methyltransferase n=1 Tax=Leptidea sinapis TaxID=189913 RepID=A0A5E4QXC9_9NEOP|nr:unnamed protein product [Leptidea sinapis]